MGYLPSGLANTVYPWTDDEPDERRRRTVFLACQDICDHPEAMPLSIRRRLPDTPFSEYTVEIPSAAVAVTYIPFPDDSGGDGTVVFIALKDLNTDQIYRFGP